MRRWITAFVVLILVAEAVVAVRMLIPSRQGTATGIVSLAPRAPTAITPAPSATVPASTPPRTSGTSTVYRDRPANIPPSVQELEPGLTAEITAWLDAWQAGELAGHAAAAEQMMQLRKLLEAQATPAAMTANLTCLICFMDGPDQALYLSDLALDRACQELAHFRAPDPAARPLIAALWSLQEVLWAQKAYAQDQKLFESLRPWETYGSAHSQWASYQYAECLQYEGGHYQQAFDEYKKLDEERKHATETSLAVNRPLDWELAGQLMLQYRYAQAVPYLRNAMKATDSPEAAEARWWLVISLARSGDRAGAKAELIEWIRLFHPDAERVAPLLALTENQEPAVINVN